MRVCLVTTYLPERTGIAFYSRDLINSMRMHDKNVKFFVLASKIKKTEESYKTSENVKYIWEKENLLYSFELIKAIQKIKPDIVHIQHSFALFGSHFGFRLLPFLFYCKVKGIPVISTLHTVWPRKNFGTDLEFNKLLLVVAKYLFLLITKLVTNLSDKIIVLNDVVGERLVSEYGIGRGKIFPIHFGLENKKSVPTETAKKKVKWSGKKILMCFGLPYRLKGYEYAIMAMPKILKKIPNAVLVITDEPTNVPAEKQYIQELGDLAKRLKIEKNVIFTRHIKREELPVYISAADVGVFPYLQLSSMSSSFYEFLMFNKPSIVTNVDTFKEIENGETGLVVPAKNSSAIAEAAIKLLNEKNLYKKIQMKMKNLLKKEWSKEETGKETLEVYKSLLR